MGALAAEADPRHTLPAFALELGAEVLRLAAPDRGESVELVQGNLLIGAHLQDQRLAGLGGLGHLQMARRARRGRCRDDGGEQHEKKSEGEKWPPRPPLPRLNISLKVG